MVQANGEGKPLKRSLSSSEEEQKMKAMLSSKPLTSKAASSSQPPSVKAVSSSKAVVSFFEKGTEAVKEAKEPKENKKNSSSSASVAPISSLSPNLEPLKDMEASVVGKEDKSKKVEKRSAGYGDASEDEEWDDGSGYKPDKKNLLKRRKTYGSTSNQAEELLPSNEEEKDTVTEVVEEKEESNGHEGGGGGGRLKGKKNFARGAIDDFVRDESEAGVNLADGGLAGNGAPSARPVKRRLVPKVLYFAYELIRFIDGVIL